MRPQSCSRPDTPSLWEGGHPPQGRAAASMDFRVSSQHVGCEMRKGPRLSPASRGPEAAPPCSGTLGVRSHVASPAIPWAAVVPLCSPQVGAVPTCDSTSTAFPWALWWPGHCDKTPHWTLRPVASPAESAPPCAPNSSPPRGSRQPLSAQTGVDAGVTGLGCAPQGSARESHSNLGF